MSSKTFGLFSRGYSAKEGRREGQTDRGGTIRLTARSREPVPVARRGEANVSYRSEIGGSLARLGLNVGAAIR